MTGPDAAARAIRDPREAARARGIDGPRRVRRLESEGIGLVPTGHCSVCNCERVTVVVCGADDEAADGGEMLARSITAAI